MSKSTASDAAAPRIFCVLWFTAALLCTVLTGCSAVRLAELIDRYNKYPQIEEPVPYLDVLANSADKYAPDISMLIEQGILTAVLAGAAILLFMLAMKRIRNK